MIPARNAEEAAQFLTEVLVPAFARAGWELWRVLTDRGSEFQGQFDRERRDVGEVQEAEVRHQGRLYVLRPPLKGMAGKASYMVPRQMSRRHNAMENAAFQTQP